MDEQQKHTENEVQQPIDNAVENAAEQELLEQNDKTANDEPSLEEKLTAINDKYLRLVAEFDNFRKRTARERLTLLLTANEEVIAGMLPVLDDFERALEAMQANTAHEISLKEGVQLIYEKLFAYLQGRGLQRIEAKGKELDTDFHEAIGKMPAPDKASKGKAIEVIQNGYTLNDKVIRFAKVMIGE